MGRVMMHASRTAVESHEAIEFTLQEGVIKIRCSVSYDALRRQAGVVHLNDTRAHRLLNWYRNKFERIALARYAAGDFREGIVTIDCDDIGSPGDRG